MHAIMWFADLRKSDTGIAGGKGANLGELTNGRLPGPGGVRRHRRGLPRDHGRRRCAGRAEGRPRRRWTPTIAAAVAEVTRRCRDVGPRRPACPMACATRSWRPTGAWATDMLVAVRSSATAEDTEGVSFAGMNRTFTNVRGESSTSSTASATAGRRCSCERVVAYRATQRISDEPSIAVIVQRMLNPVASGVMFSVDPSTGDRDRIVIEAAFGQGEVVVGGRVEPDTYVVSKEGPALREVRDRDEVPQDRGRRRRATWRSPSRAEEGAARVLSDEQILALARLGIRVEQHYGEPQDMEFVVEPDGRLWLVQSRPITTLGSATRTIRAGRRQPTRRSSRVSAPRPASCRDAVRVLASPADGAQLQAGEILVAPMTTPDWVPTIRRAAALVTDGGGMTCHAAIVSRELGVPCVVGARHATTVLRTGELVTVDGARGRVYEGAHAADVRRRRRHRRRAAARSPRRRRPARSSTSTWPSPSHADAVAALPVDGVGLLRAEFMITEALGGVHPRKLAGRGRQAEFADAMASSLLQITRAFAPRPVVYRTIDFRTNEFRGLEGGDGVRGGRGQPHDRVPRLLPLRARAGSLPRSSSSVLARVREETPNLHVMIPFVRTRWELETCLELIDAQPARPPARPASMGDGRGALGRVPDPGVRRAGDRRRLDRLQRPHPADARGRPGLRGLLRAVRRERRRPCSTPSSGSSAPAAKPGSPRRCAGRPRRTGPSSPSTSCGSASRRCR